MEAKSNKDERLEIRLQSGMKKDLTEKAEQMNISRNQLVEDVLFDFLYK
jgi:predicted HicB family RNase H-like nuclease